MQAQNPCGSGTEATTNAFKVGDDVTFVAARSTGHSVSLSVCEGKIAEIDSATAIVKLRNGRASVQPLNKLTRQSERNALTRALLGDA
jgi:plastocyanin